MRYSRVYASEDGESHIESVEVQLDAVHYLPASPALELSRPFEAQALSLARMPSGWISGLHPAPRRQFLVGLSGRVEICASDGQRLDLGAGDVALVEDRTGKGHSVRVLGAAGACGIVIVLPDQ